ncbi:hypothetical protein COU59_02915 [Candidatus Pacearchaeota archaeon CG10_big_fil_rev_8_21_14_0_10_34_12]|nr:MAG: hypothetical protein COU59_02915 [Candidatus Pacearchaeota archaeon CG10_big_fil_rev_8_21_14_0_10_34_12]
MKIQDIIIIILTVISIAVVIWYFFGNSPTFEQTILILILTLSITTIIKINVLEARFKFLVRDFKQHIKHK